MKNKNRRNSIDLVLTILILSLILFTSMACAAPVQSDSPLAPYAYITNSVSGNVSVFDTANNDVTATVNIESSTWGVNVGSSPWRVAVTPDGSKAYVGNFGFGTVPVIDTSNNTVIATVPVGEFPEGIAVTPDGTKVYVANQFSTGPVYVIDTATNNVVATVGGLENPVGVAVSPDGTKVYVANEFNHNISVIDTATNTVTATVNLGNNYPYRVAVTPDGNKVYVANQLSNTVSVIDTATNTVTATVPVGTAPVAVAVSPEGKKVYVANSESNTISIIETTTNTVTATVDLGSNPNGVTVNPAGTKVYVVNEDGTVSIIDTATNTVTATIPVGNYPWDIQFIVSPSALKSLLRVNFSSNITSGYAPLTVQFTDISQNATAWNWDFGDGTNSTFQNPEHTYSSAGHYTVKLLANNENYTDSKLARIAVLDYNISPVADFTANPTSGYAPLSVQFTDLSQNAAGWNWDFGDGITSTFQNPEHTYHSPGDYVANLTLSNENVTASKTATIHLEEEPRTGPDDFLYSHTFGSSSSGSSPEPATNIEVKELSQAIVTSGNSAKFDFLKNATSVVYVSFDSKKTTGKTTTTVEMLKNKSALTSDIPNCEVYKYLNIWVGSSGFGTSKNIENSVVCFKVEKSWIQDKNIDQSSIALNTYNDKKWNQLSTNLSGEDDKYLYFTAKTPGFSSFAITGKIKATTAAMQPSAENKTQSTVDDSQSKSTNESPAANVEKIPDQKQSTNASGKGSTKSPDFEIASGIVCLLFVHLYKKR